MIDVFNVNVERSAGTLETALSQDAPLLPAGSLVGPVPVWNSPKSPV
jgi:hypothetical protein